MQVSYREAMRQGLMRKSYQFELPPAQGRQLVIPDIHGCAKTFKALVEKVDLTRKDRLFLLGDYINRGPDSAGVVDFILALLGRGYDLWPLRGNHEEMLLSSDASARVGKKRRIPSLHQYHGLVDKDRKILPQYRAFFQYLPYYFELPDYYLVHAGFDFKKENPWEAYGQMPWIRPFDATFEQTRGKKIIVGHQPVLRPIVNKSIAENNAVIFLDNGCAMKSQPLMGQLLCFDIGTQELVAQNNIG